GARSHCQGQHIVILPNERMYVSEVIVTAGGWPGITRTSCAVRWLLGPPGRLLSGRFRLRFRRLGLHRGRGWHDRRSLFRGLRGRRLRRRWLVLRGGGGGVLAARLPCRRVPPNLRGRAAPGRGFGFRC